MVEQKFAAAMTIPLDGLEQLDLVKEWQEDFDYQHAFAMSLGLCNGTLLAEAMNLMSFLTPGSTLNGEDSPRQSSWNSGAKRSISMNSRLRLRPTVQQRTAELPQRLPTRQLVLWPKQCKISSSIACFRQKPSHT